MKNCLLILLILLQLGCKNKQEKNSISKNKNNEDFSKSNKGTKDLYDLVGFKGRREVYKIQKELIQGVVVEEVAFIDETNDRFICLIKLNNGIIQEDLSKYRIGLRFYPFEEDIDFIMNKYAKETRKLYDPNDFDPKVEYIENFTYLIKSVYSELRVFEKIELFLYDSDGYKGNRSNIISLEEIYI